MLIVAGPPSTCSTERSLWNVECETRPARPQVSSSYVNLPRFTLTVLDSWALPMVELSRLAVPEMPSLRFFRSTMLMIPPVPDAEYCAEGLVITSIRSMSLPCSVRRISVRASRPSIWMVTLGVPSKLMVSSGEIVTAGMPRSNWIVSFCAEFGVWFT